MLRTFRAHDGPVLAVHFAADGKTGFSAGSDATIRTWDLTTLAARQMLGSHAGPVRSLAITPDGKYLLSAGDDQTILRWTLPFGPSVN